MFVRLTEITHQPLVRFKIDLLIAKEQDAVRGDGFAQLSDLSLFERPGQIDVADFGPDMRRGGGYGDGLTVHEKTPSANFSYNVDYSTSAAMSG
jgi:hypothetical protein